MMHLLSEPSVTRQRQGKNSQLAKKWPQICKAGRKGPIRESHPSLQQVYWQRSALYHPCKA